MQLRIQLPESYASERRYVCHYIFERRLGIAVEYAQIEPGSASGKTLIADGEGRSIAIPDGLFSVPEAHWCGTACTPVAQRLVPGIASGNAIKRPEDVVTLYGGPGDGQPATRRTAEDRIDLTFDPLGSIFFLLTAMQEVIEPARDEHGRFPSSRAWASLEGLTHRPIVDETVAFLGDCIEVLWPGICRPTNTYRVCPSHDLDHPFLYHGLSAGGVLRRVARRLAGDLVLRKSAYASGETLAQFLQYLAHGPERDPYFTIDALMDISEARGLVSCFYVIVDANGPMDGRRYIQDPLFHKSLQRISARGHKIGLHASYACYRDSIRARNEAMKLRRLLDDLGIRQDRLGVRQHYLRWSGPEHWRIWNDAGMDYDATMSFSDRIGYRCGTSQSFPVFDLVARKTLMIEERPLLVMDVAFCPATEREWHRKQPELFADIREIIDSCRRHQGEFEIVWHNTQIQNRFLRDAYQEILAEACEDGPATGRNILNSPMR